MSYKLSMHKLDGETIADLGEYFLEAKAEKVAVKESRNFGPNVVVRITGPKAAHTYRNGRRYRLFN